MQSDLVDSLRGHGRPCFGHVGAISLNLFFVRFHLEKGVEAEIASCENECSVDIDWASAKDVLQPAQFVEQWRLILWDKAFHVYFDKKR